MKTEQPLHPERKLSFTVFKLTSGDKCTKRKAATALTVDRLVNYLETVNNY